MEENQSIKMRQKTNLLMYSVSKQKDVLMSGEIVDCGCTSDDETCANILRQKEGVKCHSNGRVQVKK